MDREEAISRRISVQQLDRAVAARATTDAAVLDLGVQDSGRDGASWMLANRGVPVASAAELEQRPDLALVWTLRGAPHYYRRRDLPDVAVATSPFGERDAAKRVVGAGRSLAEAGIPVGRALAEVAARLHDVVREPLAKGEASGRVSGLLGEPYLRDCASCGSRHVFEQLFRLAALPGGLELVPGTSPPVLRRIPDWSRTTHGPAEDPPAAPARLQVVRGYLRLFPPATPKDVATFLDAPVADVRSRWPTDAVPVRVGDQDAWQLPGDPPATGLVDLVRLLGPFDLLLQGRDRDLLVPDPARHRALWPPLGRPGAVLVGTTIVGTWRPRTTGRRLALTLDLWQPLGRAVRARVDAEAERLAAHRGVTLAGVETS